MLVDVDVIKQLVEMMVEHDLAEVSIRDGEEQISLKKGQAPQVSSAAVPAASNPLPAPAAQQPAAAEAPPPAKEGQDADAGLVAILSPMVGTFYAAPDPASPPFVKPGDTVSADTVVCVIEAMKVFNEIKAGVAGPIERALVANETPVEYDQTLFLVRPT